MKRAAVYARFSTDLQQERSIDDQIALCRSLAARQALEVVATYKDSARSGASLHGRDGILALLSDARSHRFDIVLVEAFDRLARDVEDLAGIFKRLSFLGIAIRAVHDGEADAVTIGIRGLVGQMQREDGAKKVRRGMSGVVRDGRHAGGRAYGYRAVPGRKGELVVEPAEAEIVRRIFAEYIAGKRPRAIAGALNAERIAPPRGRRWSASTINGNLARGHGILLNPLYAGRIVWNRVRMVKDPDTGRRVSRPNAAAEHQAIDAPALRIVDEATWRAAQTIKAERGSAPFQRSKPPARLLSGILRCGCCDGGMAVHDRDRSGKPRVRCTTARESGSCDHRRIILLEKIERATIDGLRARLTEPKFLAAYVEAYNDERKRLAGAAAGRKARLERRAGEVARELGRAVEAILKGTIDAATLAEPIKALESERDAIAAELAAMAQTAEVITLHPAAIARYRADLDRLSTAIAGRVELGDADLLAAFRALVQRVTVHPSAGREFELEITGHLAELTRSNAFPARLRVCGVQVVAEEGLEPPTRGL